MAIRIRFARQTVKALQRRLQKAYEQDDVRSVRHIGVLLEHVVDGQPVAQVSARWGIEEWPRILRKTRQRKALLLFGDEASFPQWGSLGYTWARRGQQPLVKTSGKRKGYKVFGLIDYFSGRFFHQAIEGRFNSENYQAFLREVLRQTRKHLFLIQDGARYHTSKATRQFFEAHRRRLTVCQLPSYPPDYNPIEYLWKKIKALATHDKYFAKFEHLVSSVDKALVFFAERCQDVLNLFGLYCVEVGLQPQSAQ
jgi:transposase